MSAILFANGKQYYALPTGIPNVGGKLYTYAAGTSTPQATWADAAQVTPNTNPVILDARGEALIFWNGNYKVVLRDASDNIIWTVDNIRASDFTGSTGASQIGVDGGGTVQDEIDYFDDRINWVPRIDIPMNGGDVNFVTSDTYGNTNDGASGGNWYYGRKLTGTINGSPAPTDRGHSGVLLMVDSRFDDANITGSTFGMAIQGRMVMTGATQGGRIGTMGVVDQKVAAHASNTNRNYVGTAGNCHTYSGDGGTNTTTGAKGAYFGFGGNVFLHDGAVNVLDGVGAEIDTVFHANATVRYASGLTLANGQAVRGVDVDCGLRFSAYTDVYGAGIGWKQLICNTDANSANPTYSGSTLWGTKWITNPSTPRAVTHGLDWSGHTFSGSIIKTPTLEINTNLWRSSTAEHIIELANGTRSYQMQPVTSGDFFRILAGGAGDLVHFHASGKHVLPQGLLNFANDAAAAAGGIEVNGLYRNGSVVMIRVV